MSEPITFEWLESLGFILTGGGASLDRWFIFKTPEGTPPGVWQIRWQGAVMNRHRRFDTREDLENLWNVLGVDIADKVAT